MWTNLSEKEKAKKIVMENIKEIINRGGLSDFDLKSAYFLSWLSENENSKTFEDFVMYVIFETQWYLSGYREDGGVWAELLFPSEEDLYEFAMEWVAEEDRKRFIDGLEEFLRSRETDP